MEWPPGNVKYDRNGSAGFTLFVAYAPGSTAALGTAGSWDYSTCAGASYGGDGDTNAPLGDNIKPGHGLCVQLPDKRYVLLVVETQNDHEIVLDVTSWSL
jgi:hypothetical protein